MTSLKRASQSVSAKSLHLCLYFLVFVLICSVAVAYFFKYILLLKSFFSSCRVCIRGDPSPLHSLIFLLLCCVYKSLITYYYYLVLSSLVKGTLTTTYQTLHFVLFVFEILLGGFSTEKLLMTCLIPIQTLWSWRATSHPKRRNSKTKE